MAEFSFTNLSSGSVYFTYETVRNSNEVYDNGSLKAAAGSFTSFIGVNEDHMVQSDYIWSAVIPEGLSSFTFIPENIVPAGSVNYRGTGNLTVTITA
jgi:hypothetical protein